MWRLLRFQRVGPSTSLDKKCISIQLLANILAKDGRDVNPKKFVNFVTGDCFLADGWYNTVHV